MRLGGLRRRANASTPGGSLPEDSARSGRSRIAPCRRIHCRDSGDSGDPGCSGSSEDAGKSSPEVAREAPSVHSERFGVAFLVDFRRFSRFCVADRARAPRVNFRVDFRCFSSCLAQASRLDPTGPTLTKVWQGHTFVRVGRCALEPQID